MINFVEWPYLLVQFFTESPINTIINIQKNPLLHILSLLLVCKCRNIAKYALISACLFLDWCDLVNYTQRTFSSTCQAELTTRWCECLWWGLLCLSIFGILGLCWSLPTQTAIDHPLQELRGLPTKSRAEQTTMEAGDSFFMEQLASQLRPYVLVLIVDSLPLPPPPLMAQNFFSFAIEVSLALPHFICLKLINMLIQVISPVPQIEQYKLQPGWEFILVATDGVQSPKAWP